MKKYFLLAAAAATVLAVSCNKEKNQPTTDPTPQIEDNTPQPILFGASSVEVKSPLTKAAVENNIGWTANEKLYIYGVKTGIDFNSTTGDPILINNVPADVPSTFTGSRDAINVYKDATTQQYYYYGASDEVYDFYGYYIGGAYPGKETLANNNKVKDAPAQWQPIVAATSITLPVTIDGTQDIMIAGTDKYADYIAAGSPNIAISKLYSEASARKLVKPDLLFKHQLARFKFETKYGGTSNPDDITINSIKIADVPINAIMTIAGTNVGTALASSATDTNFSDLYLWNSDGTSLSNVHPNASSFAGVGESIMVIPSDYQKDGEGNRVSTIITPTEYKVVLNMTQDTGNATQETADREFTVKFTDLVDGAGAPIPHPYVEAGKLYVVRMVIYGLEKVEITVSLEDWEYGGATELDNDAEDSLPVTLGAFTLANAAGGTGTANDPYTLAVGGTATAALASATINSGAIDLLQNGVTVAYTSSNSKVATVDGTTVTAVGTGVCKIYAYIQGGTVTVSSTEYKYQNAIASVELAIHLAEPLTATALAGLDATHVIDNTSGNATWTISGVTVQAAGSDIPAGYTLTYQSSDTNVATVDAGGVVAAVGNGTANITVSYAGDGTYAPCNGIVAVTVCTPAITSLANMPSAQNLSVNGTYTILGVTVQAAGSDIPAGYTLTYQSSNTNVATVDENGVVTAVAAGNATISIRYAGDQINYKPVEDSFNVTVS